MPIKGYKKYNWEKLRNMYIEGVSDNGRIIFPNLHELSQRTNVKYMAIRQKSAAGDWVRKREIYRKKLENSIKKESVKVLASQITQFDFKSLEIAKAGILHIKMYFLAHKQLVEEARKKKENIPLLNHRVLDSLARALVMYQKAGKIAINEESLPPNKEHNKALQEFLEKEKILTWEQREQFFKIALKYERELSRNVKEDNENS